MWWVIINCRQTCIFEVFYVVICYCSFHFVSGMISFDSIATLPITCGCLRNFSSSSHIISNVSDSHLSLFYFWTLFIIWFCALVSLSSSPVIASSQKSINHSFRAWHLVSFKPIFKRNISLWILLLKSSLIFLHDLAHANFHRRKFLN